jgi:hypothetical protein
MAALSGYGSAEAASWRFWRGRSKPAPTASAPKKQQKAEAASCVEAGAFCPLGSDACCPGLTCVFDGFTSWCRF